MEPLSFESLLEEASVKKARKGGSRLERIVGFLKNGKKGQTRASLTKTLFDENHPSGYKFTKENKEKDLASIKIAANAVKTALGDSKASINGGDFSITVEEDAEGVIVVTEKSAE